MSKDEVVDAQMSPDPDAETPPQEAASSALVRLSEEPPAVVPAIVLDDLVPFPGPVVPILLETQARRDAVLHAKSNHGFFALVNRHTGDREPPSLGDIAA